MEIRDVDHHNLAELKELARLYASVPLEWDPHFEVKLECIQSNYRWLIDKKAELKCILLIHNAQISGIHILYKERRSSDCYIKTLWLNPHLRGQGLGNTLKQMGEEWAKKQGATQIITHVMSDNPKMLEINLRKGFRLHKVELIKEPRIQGSSATLTP